MTTEVKSSSVNSAGNSYCAARLSAGDVNSSSSWAFSADEGSALLGASGDDWTNYSKWHLGVDSSAADKTKARYKYPFGKGGKVYRSALTAIRQRAGQQGDTAVYDAAGRHLEKIDGKESLSGRRWLQCELEVKFAPKGTEEPGTFEGYGAVFGNTDSYGDVIAPGAFAYSLSQHKAMNRMPKMLLMHGGMIGPAEDSIPVGEWLAMAEDGKGLHCKGRLFAIDTQKGRYIHEGLKSGALDGLSIGYVPVGVKYGATAEDPERTLTQVDLHECSIVTFPANDQATITQCKAHTRAIEQLETLPEFEAYLRELGLSRQKATAFVVRLKKSLSQSDSDRHSTELLRTANDAVRGLLNTITHRR